MKSLDIWHIVLLVATAILSGLIAFKPQWSTLLAPISAALTTIAMMKASPLAAQAPDVKG